MPTEDTSQQAAIAETHPAAPLKDQSTPTPALEVAEDPTHPAAPPRTSSLEVENPGGHVGGSHAVTTERVGTPPHTEAAGSGIFSASETAPDRDRGLCEGRSAGGEDRGGGADSEGG